MKSIFFAIIFSLICIIPLRAEENKTKEAIETFDSILQCQASIKITSYYVDIYQSFRVNLDKLKHSDNANEMTTKFRQDWTRLEKLAFILKQYLQGENFPVQQFEAQNYQRYQFGFLTSLTAGDRNKHLLDAFIFINKCTDKLKEAEKVFSERPELGG
jgi:hypothetical protein